MGTTGRAALFVGAGQDAISANRAVAQSWMVLPRGSLQPGERVVVQGAGDLGRHAVAATKRTGAGQVVAVDAATDRLPAAAALGTDGTVDVTEVTDPGERARHVRPLTGGGADVVLEVAGVVGVLDAGVRTIAPGGRSVDMDQITRGSDVFPLPALALLMRTVSLTGVALHDPVIRRDMVAMLGDLCADPEIRRLGSGPRSRPEGIDAAFEDAVSHEDADRPVLDLATGGSA